jgi:hypothetical protein
MPDLFHYTCTHGRRGIGKWGLVLPVGMVNPGRVSLAPARSRFMTEWAWFTTEPVPDAEALGLTRHSLRCDRTAYRYRVVEETPGLLVPWRQSLAHAAAAKQPDLLAELEEPPLDPTSWWVASHPIRVRLG